MDWIYAMIGLQVLVVVGVSFFLLRKIYNLYVDRKRRRGN